MDNTTYFFERYKDKNEVIHTKYLEQMVCTNELGTYQTLWASITSFAKGETP